MAQVICRAEMAGMRNPGRLAVAAMSDHPRVETGMKG